MTTENSSEIFELKNDVAPAAEEAPKKRRGRPRKNPVEATETAATEKPKRKPRATKKATIDHVPRDQPSEWIVPRPDEGDEAPASARPRAVEVKPIDEDTVMHASHETTDITVDEINARRENGHPKPVFEQDSTAEPSSFSASPAKPVADFSAEAEDEAPQQYLSRKEYWRQRRQERYEQRKQRREMGTSNATVAPQKEATPTAKPQQPQQAQQQFNSDTQAQRPISRKERQRARQLERRNAVQAPVPANTPEQPNESLPPMKASDLQMLPYSMLLTIAQEQGILNDGVPSHSKHDIIFALLRNYSTRGGAIIGEGVLELAREGHGYLRNKWNDYKDCPEDVMVTLQLIRKHGLRAGDSIEGVTRSPTRDQRERRYVMTDVTLINGMAPAEITPVALFDELTPTYPKRRISLTTDTTDALMDEISLFTPFGFGQRALITTPTPLDASNILLSIAQSITTNYSLVDVSMVFLNERPEAIPTLKNTASSANVYATSFDESAEDAVKMTENVINMAKRNAERGRDTVVLLNSITQFARACREMEPETKQILVDGFDVNVIQRVKSVMSSARAFEENEGSLTIIALADTCTTKDATVLEWLSHVANLELHLTSDTPTTAAPQVDRQKSFTLNESEMLDSNEYEQMLTARQND